MSESELRQEISELRAEIDRVDEWATGLFQVLTDVLAHQLKAQPELASWLEPMWRRAAERFDQLQSDDGQNEDWDETKERLEPCKMLYRMFDIAGLWTRPGDEK